MANREKKLTAGRKQTSASPTQLKEEAEGESSSSKVQEKEETPSTSTPVLQSARLLNKKAALQRKDSRKITKSTFKINLKTKTKNSKFAAKHGVIGKVAKGVNAKKLNNGVAKGKIVRKRGKSNDLPPVLEPINSQVNKSGKKKAPVLRSEGASTVSATIESIVAQFSGSSARRRTQYKTMKKESLDTVAECIEDVVNDATFIKEEDIKKEIDEDLKIPPKKVNQRKSKIERKVKKENIENTLGPTDMSDSNVIDMLDLNVRNVKSKTVEQRRHSIEKFQITNPDGKSNPHTSLFGNVPRSVSPKIKRPAKTRSLDAKRGCPYNTRVEQPARLLRNGKQRKMKKLLDGLEGSGAKKRIRSTGSEHSGSEVSFFQLSGCESDSSFSDLASVQGCENRDNLEIKDMLIKKEILETIENNAPDIINKDLPNYTQILKRSMSSESGAKSKETSDAKTIDTNSNLCTEVTKEQASVKSEVASPDEAKVAEKNKILDIMKQTFNDVGAKDKEETDKRKTRSSYKKTSVKEAEEEAPQSAATSSATPVKEIEIREIVVTEEEQVPAVDDLQLSDVEMEELQVEQEHQEEMEVEENEQTVLDEKEETKETEEAQVEENVVAGSSGNSVEMETENGKAEIVETPENLLKKAEILEALGLQSSQAAAENDKSRKVVPKTNAYTGTLKTVIKLNRCEKKKRTSLKLTLQKKGKPAGKDDDLVKRDEDEYKIMKDGHSTSWKSQHGGQSSDTAGAQRKSHYINRSNMDGSSEHTSDGDNPVNEEDATKNLVIPEKASSFSIHPDRLCKDECSYCFGKFGLFDTPCHIAQMKSIDRQNKILSTEKHLTRDSCLCDACYRHVDRKSNMPSYGGKQVVKRRVPLVAPGPKQNHCHVLGCGQISSKILRRKWLVKMKKTVCQVINIDLDNLGLHSIPICEDHYSQIAHLMDCAMCKRRLARNHIHYLGAETNEVSAELNEMGIPVDLNDRLVCKLCRYFATLILKSEEERLENCQKFFIEYKRRLLHFHNIELMDDAQAVKAIPDPAKNKTEGKEKNEAKRRKIMSKHDNLEPPVLEPQVVLGKESCISMMMAVSGESRPGSPNDYLVDYNSLIPNIALECGSNDLQVTRKEVPKTNSSISIKRISGGKSVESSALDKSKSKNKSDIAVQRLGSNPSISVRQLFPGEEELQLNAIIEFNNVKERTPEGWEKCVSTIQYDQEIKLLWQELQKPYGNQSSFLRHLILLEKYFRNGDLLLSPTASHHSVNYTESVQNRLRAYDNIRTAANPQPLPASKPSKKYSLPAEPMVTSPVKIPTPPPPAAAAASEQQPAKPVILLETSPNGGLMVPNPAAMAALSPSTSVVPTIPSRPKPPGLISLQPGTKIPINSTRQKIKFPIMKDWRPNLIPIDPSQKYEKKPGLVQVISGGKPYHIALDDYKKMCAIKHKFDMHQRRKHQRPTPNVNSLLKNSSARRSLIITKASPTKGEFGSDQEPDNNGFLVDTAAAAGSSDMPKIPKSLTVIPQTVTTTKKVLRPSSPALLNKSKPNS